LNVTFSAWHTFIFWADIRKVSRGSRNRTLHRK
jgi:hypothetical protein